MAIFGQFNHLAIRPYATNKGKCGYPWKEYKKCSPSELTRWFQHAPYSTHQHRSSPRRWRFRKWHVSGVMEVKDCALILSCRLVAEKATPGGRISRYPSHQNLRKYEQQREGGCDDWLPQVFKILSWPQNFFSLLNHKVLYRLGGVLVCTDVASMGLNTPGLVLGVSLGICVHSRISRQVTDSTLLYGCLLALLNGRSRHTNCEEPGGGGAHRESHKLNFC